MLRILSGETFLLEGFALNEEAKAWFARNAERLPFACVPGEGGLEITSPSESLGTPDFEIEIGGTS